MIDGRFKGFRSWTDKTPTKDCRFGVVQSGWRGGGFVHTIKTLQGVTANTLQTGVCGWERKQNDKSQVGSLFHDRGSASIRVDSSSALILEAKDSDCVNNFHPALTSALNLHSGCLI